MKDIIVEFMIPFLLLMSLVVIGAYFAVSMDCNRYADATGRATKMSGATCYINKGDEWYSRDEFKHVVIDR